MKNSITVGLAFSYQGKSYSPSATIDLDALMEQGTHLPDLHGLLASRNNIDTYSYLYEVMESHDIEFSNITGLAGQCLRDGHFDTDKFARLWHEQRELEVLDTIAKEQLGIDSLEQRPDLKAALIAAFRAGKNKTTD